MGLEHTPFAVLADKLEAMQRALFNIGTSIQGGGRRGSWKAEVVRACEIRLLDVHHSDLVIVGEVAPSDALPHPDFDLGLQSLRRFEETISAVASADRRRVARIYPDFALRSRVLKSISPLLPDEGSDYEVVFELADKRRETLKAGVRDFITQSAAMELDDESQAAVRTVTGRLFRIEVETGERQLGVFVGNRKIRCFFPPAYEEVVRELVPGTLVEIEGHATLDSAGRIQRIEEVLDARPIRVMPLHWTRVVHGSRVFRLKNPITIDVDYRQGLWTHEYEPLGMLAYAPTRRDSLESFREDFACTWDTIAQEEDESLTPDARDLKRRMLALVAKTEVSE